MNHAEFMKQAIPAALAAQVKETFRLLASLDKISWPSVPTTGDLLEHVR
jgi:hypothetical protein